MGRNCKKRNDTIGSPNLRCQKSRMTEACIDLLKIELDSLAQKQSAGGEMEVVHCKAADAKGEVNSLVYGLRRGTFSLYANIRQNVDQSLSAVGSRL